ncbi:hypothetical protein HanIR_Chr12g0564451 [Helianthus annuus]|nr:hypothetical protein HanIR_Chr12g0564451 [Helianthus annuus]
MLTFTSPAWQFSRSGYKPESVIPDSPLNSTFCSCGHSVPKMAKFVFPNPMQSLTVKDRRDAHWVNSGVSWAKSLIPIHLTIVNDFKFDFNAPKIPC